MPHQLCKDRPFFSSPYPMTFCLWGPLTNKTENYWLFRKHLMVFRRSTSNTTLVYVSHTEASFKVFIKYECSSWSCFSLFMKYSHSLERRCIICSTCTRNRNEGTWKSLKIELMERKIYMQWRSWLRHCATNWKVADSISDGVMGIFHWHNTSGRTVALGSIQIWYLFHRASLI